MNILEELKLSKKQNNDKRYDYLCEQFNAVDYAIKLEKYTIKLQKENKILKEKNKQLKGLIDKAVLELANIDGNLSNGQLSDRICNLIDILNGVSE